MKMWRINLRGLLCKQGLVDMRDDSSPGNGGLDERVKLLVPSDSKLDVTRGDRASLEIRNTIANSSILQHLHTLRSLLAFPANSSNSATKYSMIPAPYTAAEASTF